MAYVGYVPENKLPFRQRQEVVIPKGTLVRHRGQERPAGRTYKVVVNHLMPGSSKSIVFSIADHDRDRYPHAARLFAEYDRLREAAKTAEGEERNRLLTEAYDMQIPITNPSICWAGAGGYWSEADINDLLEANGIVLEAGPGTPKETEDDHEAAPGCPA
jgi:hypothetical protein